MQAFQIIQLVLAFISCVAAVTGLFTLGSPTSKHAMFVGQVALAGYIAMRAWEVRHTHPGLRMLLTGTAGLSWFLALLHLFSLWFSRSK